MFLVLSGLREPEEEGGHTLQVAGLQQNGQGSWGQLPTVPHPGILLSPTIEKAGPVTPNSSKLCEMEIYLLLTHLES